MKKEIQKKLILLNEKVRIRLNNSNRYMLNNPALIYRNISSIISGLRVKAWNSYFIESNIPLTKNILYNIGLLVDSLDSKCHYLWSSNEYTGYLLLSDSKELIYKFSDWECDSLREERHLGPTEIIKLILRGDQELVAELFEIWRNRDHIKGNEIWKGDVMFLDGLISGNNSLICDGIKHLLTPEIHEARNGIYNFRKKILSFPAIMYAKCAILKGFELDLEHDLIPTGLIANSYIEDYKVDFFFLEGYKGELPEPYVKWLDAGGDWKRDRM